MWDKPWLVHLQKLSPRGVLQKGCYQNFAKFTIRRLRRTLFLVRLQAFSLRKVFKNTFFKEHFRRPHESINLHSSVDQKVGSCIKGTLALNGPKQTKALVFNISKKYWELALLSVLISFLVFSDDFIFSKEVNFLHFLSSWHQICFMIIANSHQNYKLSVGNREENVELFSLKRRSWYLFNIKT